MSKNNVVKSNEICSETVPHQAIISVNIDIMERLPDGRVTGLPIKRLGKIFTVTGKDLAECEAHLQTLMTRFNGDNNNEWNTSTRINGGYSAVKKVAQANN